MAGVTGSATAPGQLAMAVAIVTGPSGVLIGRRGDGVPLWTLTMEDLPLIATIVFPGGTGNKDSAIPPGVNAPV